MSSICSVEHGTVVVYRNAAGELHREDGPAIEYADGNKEYWIEGSRLSAEAFKSIAPSESPVRVKFDTDGYKQKLVVGGGVHDFVWIYRRKMKLTPV